MRLNNDILQRSVPMCCVFASCGCAGPMGGRMAGNEGGVPGLSVCVFGMGQGLLCGQPVIVRYLVNKASCWGARCLRSRTCARSTTDALPRLPCGRAWQTVRAAVGNRPACGDCSVIAGCLCCPAPGPVRGLRISAARASGPTRHGRAQRKRSFDAMGCRLCGWSGVARCWCC